MGYYIGIDLGTSSVKLMLTDAEGTVLRESEREYSLLQPAPGWKEIDARTWWQETLAGLEELLASPDQAPDKAPDQASDQAAVNDPDQTRVKALDQAPDSLSRLPRDFRRSIRGIGVTGQMHSLVLLDRDGEPARPVLMWNDTRTKDLIPGLKDRIAETPSAHIAKILSTGSPAANLYWVRENEPDVFSRVRRFLIGPDYIVYRLTGAAGTDFCEASTSSIYDLLRMQWSPDMLSILGIDEAACPPVRGSAEPAGTLLPGLSARLGLPADCIVVTGTGDNPAASIPTVCLGSGWPVLSLGTSGVLMFPRSEPDFEARGKNILFSFGPAGSRTEAAQVPVYTLTQGVVQSCGSGYNWLIRRILEMKDFSMADRGIDPGRLGQNRVLFYPHMTGDKTIYQDPTLRGAFLGLGTETSRPDLVQAFMEGIAYAVRELIETMALPPSMLRQLRIIGGGSRSRVWMQIFADVLDTEILQLEGSAGAGCGAAMLAACACGEIRDPRGIADRTVTVRERFLPDPRAAALYREGYRRYLRIHDALKMVYAD